jgi:serine-type D-Ala-D-Ala carboxypeptidase
MASVTKPVACATSAMILLERGAYHAHEEVRSFFPERSLPHWAGITIHHLVTHTSGLPDWCATYEKGEGEEACMNRLFEAEMKAKPGERYEYSCLGYITLGKVLERVSGKPLDEFTGAEIFGPLGMKRTGYRRISKTPAATADDNIAPTVFRENDSRGKIYGHVHDGNAAAIDGVSGNAGLFSTAEDMLTCGRMLLSKGGDLLSPLGARMMLTSQIDKAVGCQSWGFFCGTNGLHPAGDLLREGTVGHTGFTGTSLVLHPEYDLVAVLLTNRVLTDTSGHIRARRIYHNVIAAALAD